VDLISFLFFFFFFWFQYDLRVRREKLVERGNGEEEGGLILEYDAENRTRVFRLSGNPDSRLSTVRSPLQLHYPILESL